MNALNLLDLLLPFWKYPFPPPPKNLLSQDKTRSNFNCSLPSTRSISKKSLRKSDQISISPAGLATSARQWCLFTGSFLYKFNSKNLLCAEHRKFLYLSQRLVKWLSPERRDSRIHFLIVGVDELLLSDLGEGRASQSDKIALWLNWAKVDLSNKLDNEGRGVVPHRCRWSGWSRLGARLGPWDEWVEFGLVVDNLGSVGLEAGTAEDRLHGMCRSLR